MKTIEEILLAHKNCEINTRTAVEQIKYISFKERQKILLKHLVSMKKIEKITKELIKTH